MLTNFTITNSLKHTNMSNWTYLIGNLALIWTIGLFLCGVQICFKIYNDRSVGDISPLPFLTAFLKYIFQIKSNLIHK
jgi:hypothetical protein